MKIGLLSQLTAGLDLSFAFMIVPGAVVFEPLQTIGTLVGFLSCVNPQVGEEVVLLTEPTAALIALERLLPSVSSLVAPELLISQELLRTETAGFVVSTPVMSLLVAVSHSFPIKPLPTLGTHKLFQVQMRLHVGFICVFSRKTFLTDFTCERLQPRMYNFPVI